MHILGIPQMQDHLQDNKVKEKANKKITLKMMDSIFSCYTSLGETQTS